MSVQQQQFHIVIEREKRKKIRQIIGRISPAWRSGVRLIPFVGESCSEHATSSAIIIFLLAQLPS